MGYSLYKVKAQDYSILIPEENKITIYDGITIIFATIYLAIE